jgi:hypothetical protein
MCSTIIERQVPKLLSHNRHLFMSEILTTNEQQLFELITQNDSLLKSWSILEMEAPCFDSLCFFLKKM